MSKNRLARILRPLLVGLLCLKSTPVHAFAVFDALNHQLQQMRLAIQQSELAKAADVAIQVRRQLQEVRKISKQAELELRRWETRERRARHFLRAIQDPRNCSLTLLQEALGMPVNPAYYLPHSKYTRHLVEAVDFRGNPFDGGGLSGAERSEFLHSLDWLFAQGKVPTEEELDTALNMPKLWYRMVKGRQKDLAKAYQKEIDRLDDEIKLLQEQLVSMKDKEESDPGAIFQLQQLLDSKIRDRYHYLEKRDAAISEGLKPSPEAEQQAAALQVAQADQAAMEAALADWVTKLNRPPEWNRLNSLSYCPDEVFVAANEIQNDTKTPLWFLIKLGMLVSLALMMVLFLFGGGDAVASLGQVRGNYAKVVTVCFGMVFCRPLIAGVDMCFFAAATPLRPTAALLQAVKERSKQKTEPAPKEEVKQEKGFLGFFKKTANRISDKVFSVKALIYKYVPFASLLTISGGLMMLDFARTCCLLILWLSAYLMVALMAFPSFLGGKAIRYWWATFLGVEMWQFFTNIFYHAFFKLYAHLGDGLSGTLASIVLAYIQWRLITKVPGWCSRLFGGGMDSAGQLVESAQSLTTTLATAIVRGDLSGLRKLSKVSGGNSLGF